MTRARAMRAYVSETVAQDQSRERRYCSNQKKVTRPLAFDVQITGVSATNNSSYTGLDCDRRRSPAEVL
jgi:hypothetical protein